MGKKVLTSDRRFLVFLEVIVHEAQYERRLLKGQRSARLAQAPKAKCVDYAGKWRKESSLTNLSDCSLSEQD